MKDPSFQLKDEIYTRYKQGEAVVDENFPIQDSIKENLFRKHALQSKRRFEAKHRYIKTSRKCRIG